MEFESKTGHALLGQPWVFFSCHPAKFDTYKEQVKDDVLACCDCVFCWWDPSDALPDSLDELNQIGLFVFAVDRAFIEQDCPANTVLWNYALEHHIPILPLIMEEDIILAFNERFGEIHALLGYGSARRERLESYFDRLFVRSDLATEIRQSFDAHLFLSYRKVDAADAAELIKSLRKLDYCRDVAIWFDAYLSPGENFDENISEALRECDLFLLLVTPSLLLNENNYVRCEEFPAAQRTGRAILPIEMEPTDRITLQTWYAGIPESVDGHRGAELDAGLQAHLDTHALGKNNERRHLYCMGLAYLQGIDVEVDKGQAAGFIERAAQADLQDAMRTLQQMCQDGNGVRQDFGEAARWSEKLARSLQPESVSREHAPECLTYVRQLVDAANAYAELRQTDRALELLGEGTDFLRPCAEGHDPTLDLCRALLASTTAMLQVRKGENDLARENYALATRCFGFAGQAERSSKLLCAWADALLGEAVLVAKTKQLEQGCTLVEEALSLYEESYALDHSYEAGFGCAECHHELCAYALDRDRQQQAVDHLRAGTDILREVKERHGEGRTLQELFSWHLLIGDLATVASNYEVALGAYKRAEEIILHFNRDTMTILENRHLQKIYAAIGNTYLELDQPDDAERYFFPGYLAASEMEHDIGDLQSKSDLELFCTKMGFITLERGDLDEAEDFIRKEVELSREIDRMAPTIDTRFSLGLALHQLGLLMRKRKQRKQMDEAFDEAYKIFDKLDDDTHGAPWVNSALQGCLATWNEASNELKADEPKKRTQSAGMRRAAQVIRSTETFVALAGIVTQLLPGVPSMVLPAAAVLLVSDQLCNFLLLGDAYTLLYAVFAALGAGIGLLFHAGALVGAAMGCCLISFALNALDLYARILVARARRAD